MPCDRARHVPYACSWRAFAASLQGITHVRVLAIMATVGLMNFGAVQTASSQDPPAAHAPSHGRAALLVRLESLTRSAVSEGPLVRSSLALLRGGDTRLLRAYGMADREQRAPAVAQY